MAEDIIMYEKSKKVRNLAYEGTSLWWEDWKLLGDSHTLCIYSNNGGQKQEMHVVRGV